jgi:hypothetical protein
MTRLNNEICELNSHQLDQVSGGDDRYVPPWIQRDQAIYAMRRVEAAIQKDVNNMYNMWRHL